MTRESRDDILCSPQALSSLGQRLQGLSYRRAAVISDESVYPLYGKALTDALQVAGIASEPLLIPTGEAYKTLATATHCWEQLHQRGFDRRSLVIGLGGGVVTDVAGFVASCYLRGVDLMLIPTTLLGMVDAAIGGKTGVNLPAGKNLVGTFYPPKLVVLPLETLHTLPLREVRSGLGEVIKYAFIWDPKLLTLLEQHIEDLLAKRADRLETVVRRCAEIKREIVQRDPKEGGLRAILNFGHTFGHAIETASGYGTLTHGEAVAIGMCCAAHLSVALKLIDLACLDRLEQLCQRAGLPTALPNLTDDQLIALMHGDKKAEGGQIACIVLRGVGQAEKIIVDEATLKKALKDKRIRDGLR